MSRLTELRYSVIGRRYHRILSDERRVTRRGLRRMLIEIRMHDLRREPTWKRLWAANLWAAHEAFYSWHIRLPRRYADHDRAHVAWLLRRGAESPEQQKALRWAHHRE